MNDHFGSGDAQTQSTYDETEQMVNGVDEEERDDPSDGGKMKEGLSF